MDEAGATPHVIEPEHGVDSILPTRRAGPAAVRMRQRVGEEAPPWEELIAQFVPGAP